MRLIIARPGQKLKSLCLSPSQNRTEGQYVCTNLVNPQLDFPCVEVPYSGEAQLSNFEQP